MQDIEFEWDDRKNRANNAKHGVSFEEAVKVFDDPFHLSMPDDTHSDDEERWITVGRMKGGRVILVVHTDRGNAVRLISARPATRRERKEYEEK